MNRKVLLLMAISVITAYTFAQAPDMEFFAPTEYMYMSELTKSAREAFLQKNPDIMEKAEHINSYFLDGREYPEQQILYDKIRIFSETLYSETYTWLLIPVTRMDREKYAFKNVAWVPEHLYILGLTKSENGKDSLLFIGPTCYQSTREAGGEIYVVDTYQIVKGKDKNKGIIYYHNELTFYWQSDAEQNYIFKKIKNVKGQPEGYVIAYYYLFGEQPEQRELQDSVFIGFTPRGWDYIQIQPSAFLWDLKKPLKYGLQNAFDGNPATSFVENTEDDLMKISLSSGFQEKIRIINGYASNQKLYDKNNSVKQIGIYDYKPIVVDGENFVTPIKTQNILCDAHNLDWQEFKLSGTAVFLKVEDVYQGQMYNDTCIAEINFFFNKEWLLGDIDE